MRILAVVLAGLIVLIQFPLWLGKGGWLRVWDLDRQLQTRKDRNARAQMRNAELDAEVRDLKQGLEAVEERARYDLGMIKQDEVFYQIVESPPAPQSRVESGRAAAEGGGLKKRGPHRPEAGR